MLDGRVRSRLIIDDHRTDILSLQFAPDHNGRNGVFLQISQYVDIQKQPIGEDDQPLDSSIQQHFQIAFKTAPFVVCVGKNWHIRRLVQRILNPAQNQRAVGIGHVKNHESDGVTALATQ